MTKKKNCPWAPLYVFKPLIAFAIIWLMLLRPGAQASGVAPARATSHPCTGAVDLRPDFKKWGLPLRSQGGRGTCSVFTMTGAIEYALASERGTGTVLSVEFLNWASNQATTNSSDGGFFADLWKGFERYGICAETSLPYRAHYDPGLQPDPGALAQARAASPAHLRLKWIKRWDVTTGLTEAQFQGIKQTLAGGWPVCAGMRWPRRENWRENVLQMATPAEVFDGHSVLLVGFREDPAQPGGGVFLIRNTGGGVPDGALPYAYARAYINDAAWVFAARAHFAASKTRPTAAP